MTREIASTSLLCLILVLSAGCPGSGSGVMNDPNGGADDSIPDAPGGDPSSDILEGSWTAVVDDVVSEQPVTLALLFDASSTLIELAIFDQGLFQPIDEATTTVVDQDITIEIGTDAGVVTFSGTLSEDGNAIAGSTDGELNIGAGAITIAAGALTLDRDVSGGDDGLPLDEGAGDEGTTPDPGEETTPIEPTLVELDPIRFFGDVLLGVDPASFAIGGGSVDFAGGVARSIGIPSLYFDDSFSWMPNGGVTATVTFTDLDVRKVSFFFADLGAPGAVLTAEEADGTAIESVNSFTAVLLGDSRAVFLIEAGDRSIARLTIETLPGITAALDQLILTIAE